MEDSRATPWQKIKPWLIAFSAIPAFLLIMIIYSLLVFGTWSVISGSGFFNFSEVLKEHEFYTEIVQTLIMTLSVLTVVWIYWMKIQKNNFISIGFRKGELLKELLLGAATGVVLLAVTFLLLLLFNKIEVEGIGFHAPSFLKFLLVFLLVGFHEELLTRGYFLGTFMKLANKYLALFIVAILFSLMHIFNANFSFISFLNILLAGLLLGVAYIHTQRLWFPISLHFTWNFLQGPAFGSMVSGNSTGEPIIKIKLTGNDLLTGGDFGFENSLIMTFLMIMLTIALEIYYRKRNKNIVEI